VALKPWLKSPAPLGVVPEGRARQEAVPCWLDCSLTVMNACAVVEASGPETKTGVPVEIAVDVVIPTSEILVDAARLTARVRPDQSASCDEALVVTPVIVILHGVAWFRVALPAVSVIVAPAAPDPLSPTVKVVVPQVLVTGDAPTPANVKYGTFSAISSLVASGALSVKASTRFEAVLVVGDAIVNALDVKAGR